MIKVTSILRDNRKMECIDVSTSVFVGIEDSVCKECKDTIIKEELKCLITVLIQKQPDLLFAVLEEVIGRGILDD